MTETVTGWTLEALLAGLCSALRNTGEQALMHAEKVRSEAELGNAEARSDASGLRACVGRLDAKVLPAAPLPSMILRETVEWRKEEAQVLVRLSEGRQALAVARSATEEGTRRVRGLHAVLVERSDTLVQANELMATAERDVYDGIMDLSQSVAEMRQMDARIRAIEGAIS